MKIDYRYLFLFACLLTFFSCDRTESEIKLEEDKENIFEQKFKDKEVIIYTRAFRANGERTVGGMGMPVKFKFNYDKSQPNKLYFEMPEFQFGNMPLAATIHGELDIINKYIDAYPEKKGEDWVYFGTRNQKAIAGSYVYKDGERIQYDSSPSAEVNGYYNVKTNEFFMDINFKLMSVTSICPDQQFDIHPIENFLELLDTYWDIHYQPDKQREKMFNFSSLPYKCIVTDRDGNSKSVDIPMTFSYDKTNPKTTKGKIGPIDFELGGKNYSTVFEGDIDFLFNPNPPLMMQWKSPKPNKLLSCNSPISARVKVNDKTISGAKLVGIWLINNWFGDNYVYKNLTLTGFIIKFDEGLKIELDMKETT